MKTNEEWSLFERLADNDLPLKERIKLEALVAADEELSNRFETFQTLRDWPRLEVCPDSSAARQRLLSRIAEERRESAAERELGRLFPVFFGGALAAAFVMALMNFWQFDEMASGGFDALFAMPPETVETVIVSQL